MSAPTHPAPLAKTPELPQFTGGPIVETRAVLCVYVKVKAGEMSVTFNDKTIDGDEFLRALDAITTAGGEEIDKRNGEWVLARSRGVL